MIASTKLFVLLTGSASAAVVGVGPAVHSDMTLTALLAAGAATVAGGVLTMVRREPVEH